MADIATLGLMVDASGAKREIRLTAEELKKLANGGKEAQQVMRNLAPPAVVENMQAATNATRQMATAHTANIQAVANSGAAFNRLREPLTNATRMLLGLNPAIAQITNVLGGLALGGPLMIGVLAGLAAISFGWNRLTKDARETEKATKEAIATLKALREQQLLGPLAGSSRAAEGAGIRLFFVQEQIAAMEARIAKAAQGTVVGIGASGFIREFKDSEAETKLADLQAEQTLLRNLIQAHATAVTQFRKEKADEQARDRKAATDKEIAEIERLKKAEMVWLDMVSAHHSVPLPNLRVMRDGTAAQDAQRHIVTARIGARSETLGGGIFGSIVALAQRAKDAVENAARTAKVTREQAESDAKKAALRSTLISSGLGVLSQTGEGGGAAAGIIQSGIGAAAGGPWAIAAVGVASLASAVFSFGRTAAEAAERAKQLTLSLDNTILAWKAELGLPGADTALKEAQIRQQAQAERDKITALGFNRPFVKLNQETAAEYQKRLEEINRLERARLDALGKEKEAIDSLNASALNLVQGYKLQATIFEHSNPRGPVSTVPQAGASGNLTVNVVVDGQTVGTAVLRDFKRRAVARTGSSKGWADAI